MGMGQVVRTGLGHGGGWALPVSYRHNFLVSSFKMAWVRFKGKTALPPFSIESVVKKKILQEQILTLKSKANF